MTIQTVQIVPGGYRVDGRLMVPADPANREYRAVQAWIGAGNRPAPADPEPPFEPSDTQIRLAALEAKTGVTDADRAAAKADLMTKRGQ